MRSICVSIDVPHERQRVYAFLDVMANHERFTDHMLRDSSCSGPATGVGAKARVTSVLGGRRLPVDIEVVDAVADHKKAQRVFEMTAPVSLEEGLGRMAEWAKRVGPRRGGEFAEIELSRGLPPVWLEA